MVTVFVSSMLLYASETWCLPAEDIQRIEAMEMWICRRIKKINWIDCISNKEWTKNDS